MAFLAGIDVSQKSKKRNTGPQRESGGIHDLEKPRRAQSLSRDRLEYLERMGIFFERDGLPRMAGRIFALILTAPGELVSTSEILSLLHASRGSVSTMTRFLIDRGIIEKTGQRGQRQDYFRIKTDALNSMFAKRLNTVQDFKTMMTEAIHYTEPGSENRRMVEELAGFYEWFERRLPSLWAEWENEKKRRNSQ
ncbi:MAG: hypothetical protein CMF59_07575 [Leptospiraceae bacterium]|nr:hypothetical protein [Leptospiraceae bacterium]